MVSELPSLWAAMGAGFWCAGVTAFIVAHMESLEALDNQRIKELLMPFTEFIPGDEGTGVHWDKFVLALGVWCAMRDEPPTVARAAAMFNTSAGAVIKAVRMHPGLKDTWPDHEIDPSRQVITSDGYDRI